MKFSNRYPAFLFLLPVFFFLVGYTDHGQFLQLKKLLLPYLYICTALLTSYLILNKISKQHLRNALLIFYAAVVYLFFGNLKSRFDYIPYFHSYIIFFLLLLAFPIAMHFLLRRNLKLEAKVFTYCNVLMLVLCATQCILIGMERTKSVKYKLNAIPLEEKNSNKLPSIHLILWDGYPGFHSLKDHFKFDNQEIKNFLHEKKYYVSDSIRSNYFQTYISVNSLLNMQYISYLHQVPLNEYNTVLYELQQINENVLVQFLKKNKYHIYNNSIFELDHQEVHSRNPKFKSSEAIHFNQVFHNRMLKDHLWKFIKGKYKWDYAYKKIVLQQHIQNHSTIDNLLKAKPKTPHFSYSHIIMPHDPYFTDSTGILLDRESAGKANNEVLFVNYIKYTNQKIREIVNHLSATEPNAIVIIMSDHGYREYTDEKDLPKKFDNLMAVHLPDSNYENLRQMNSNINLFRVILNQYFKQQLPLLADSCIIIDEEKNSIISEAHH